VTPEQSAAYARDLAPAYGPDAFRRLPDNYGVNHNAVLGIFAEASK
jgi:hypothetical protein